MSPKMLQITFYTLSDPTYHQSNQQVELQVVFLPGLQTGILDQASKFIHTCWQRQGLHLAFAPQNPLTTDLLGLLMAGSS